MSVSGAPAHKLDFMHISSKCAQPMVGKHEFMSWQGARGRIGAPGFLPGSRSPPFYRKCGPRLSAEAAEKLKNRYIIMRSGARQHERDSDRRSSIPITVR